MKTFCIKTRVTSLCLLTALLPLVGHAEERDLPEIRFNAFGTLGTSHSSEDHADFRTSFVQPEGAGYSHDWSFHIDSRLGLQLTAAISDRLTAVVQVVAEQRPEHDTKPEVEWANIKYDITRDFSVRGGRIVLPTFKISDTRKVGYAYPWVRPPMEVYGLLPLSSSDGADATYRFRSAGATTTVTAFAGERHFEFPRDDVWKSHDMYGVFVNTEFGDAAVRAGYQRAKIHSDRINELFDRYRLFGPQGAAIADRYDVNEELIELLTFAGRYEPGNLSLVGEWTRTESKTFIGTHTGWYGSAAYRYADFTPYVTYGQRRKQRVDEPGLDIAAVPPELQAQGVFMNMVLDRILNANDFDSVAVGMRWDFRPNYSLKFQANRFRLHEGSYGDLINVQPEFEPGSDFTVLSLNLDFVF